MKVLFVNLVYGTGSTGKIIADIMNLLKKYGNDVKTLYGTGACSDNADTVKVSGKLEYYFHNAVSRFTDHAGLYSWAATRKMIREIRAFQPDLIHLHTLHGFYVNYEMLFRFLKEANIPVVWTLHDCWTFTGHCTHFSQVKCMQWQTECRDCKLLYRYPQCYWKGDVRHLLAYLKSDYYAQYAYQRVSVDFWRGDMVSVISTGFMFTFAVALSTSILFSHCGVRKKLIALAVLLMSTFEASFFAYRTMIFIVLILVAFNLLRWLHDSSVRISRKALLIGLAALFFVAIFAIVFLNAFGIQDELLSLKIVRRLLYGDKSSRFKTWTSYLFSGDWLRYPFGGQKSEFAYHGEWVHNLWLDILNKVGLIPFVIAVIFTITSIRSAYGAAVRMKKANHNLLSNQIASLGLGALLICMPEPVVDANPYFFFAILMLLGGIKGVECSFGKEDTAESERGF